MNFMKDKYTIQEAAELLGVTIRTLELREKEGKINILREKNKRRYITSDSIKTALGCEVCENCEGESENSETNETTDKFYEPEIVPPVERQPIPIIDIGRNFLTEVDEKILSSISANNEKLIKQFQDMLDQQTENTAAALDKQREYFEGIIAQAEEKNIQLINENKNLVMELQSKQDKLEENLRSRVKETEEKIEAWREEQKNRSRTWWQKLFGK